MRSKTTRCDASEKFVPEMKGNTVIDAVLLAALAGICFGIALAWTGCALAGIWLGWRLVRQPAW